MKEQRIKMLSECVEKILEIQTKYMPGHSGWILLQAAQGHLKSLHYLEDANFEGEHLGVKSE